jgi:hypothetical protein
VPEPHLTSAIAGCQNDYIAILEFQTFYVAVGNFLLERGDEWLRYLESKSLPVNKNPHYKPDFHHDFLAHYMIRAAAEMFLNYLTDLLRAIFLSRPEILRSSAQVKVDDVLRHTGMDDFVRWYADRKVTELSYSSLVDLDDYFSKQLGLPICTDPDEFLEVRRLVAKRNLLVHARAVVNEVYRKAAAEPDAEIGTVLELDFKTASEEPGRVYDLVKALDMRASQKFGI